MLKDYCVKIKEGIALKIACYYLFFLYNYHLWDAVESEDHILISMCSHNRCQEDLENYIVWTKLYIHLPDKEWTRNFY